jgi:putative transposase
MKRKRFTEGRIIGVLKEREPGAKTAELCRKRGISEATFSKWKTNSEAKRLPIKIRPKRNRHGESPLSPP